MSPRTSNPAIKPALIEAAARIVATEGRAALTLRRLAAEAGTSTMAIYTYFGNTEELSRAIRREGFHRLRTHLAAVVETEDPVADLILMGTAYYLSANDSPNLYRAMFLDGPVDDADYGTGLDTFMYLVRGISRCQDTARFHPRDEADPLGLALQLWGLTHGLVSLQLANLLTSDDAAKHVAAGGQSLFVAWGDSERRVQRSSELARERLGELLFLGHVGEPGEVVQES